MSISELREKANQQEALSQQLYHNHWGTPFLCSGDRCAIYVVGIRLRFHGGS